MSSGNTELYIIRHGETELNAKGVYYGWTDCSLSEKGLMQAEELADILQEISFDAVISSSLERAKLTAAIVSGFPADDILTDDRLRELNFGAWEGMHRSDIMSKYKDAWEKWGRDWKDTAPPEGESFRELFIRVKSCIEDILAEHKGKKILIVSHQGVIRVICAVLMKLPEDAYWSFTAEQGRYSHFEIDESGLCIIRRINSGR